MKHGLVTASAVAATLVVFSLAAGAARADELTLEIAFGSPSFPVDAVGKGTDVHIEGLLNTAEAGLPSLPVDTRRLALPQGAVLEEATLVATSPERSLNVSAKRAPSMMPLSWNGKIPSGAKLAAADEPAILGSSYPAARIQAGVQYLHGIPVVIANLFPVTTDGANETLSFIASARLTLRYHVEATTTRPPFRHEAERVASFVDNGAALRGLVAGSPVNADGYDYLIVTSDAFKNYTGANNLNDLVATLGTRGLRAHLVTVTEATSFQTGVDKQEKIRNYIKAQYATGGIQYVLLAADGDSSGAGGVIPARRLWSRIRAYDGAWKWIEEQIPADLYYGNLDGTFNANGNANWGEDTDGVNGGDVDFLAELAVGRMPMKTTAELANFVAKTMWVDSNVAQRHTLLMGEELFPEKDLYGDDYMNQLVGQCTDHGYVTSGYGPDWTEAKLYDRGGSWSGSTALRQISAGDYSMINHLGHSNTTYNMRLDSTFGFPAFTNQKPFFYYTQGCFPGDFTANDSFIEMLVRHQNGAFAAIANTCYGLAPEDPQPDTTVSPGASQMLHRRFIDAIFTQGLTALGKAHVHSKEAFIGLTSAQEVRWVNWDANFFGDPAIALHF